MKTLEVFVVQLATAPRGRFGAVLLAAMRRYGLLPETSAPLTPAVRIEVYSLPVMRTFPIRERARLDFRW